MSAAIPWAAAVLIIALVVIFRFTPELRGLIGRAHSLGGRFGLQAAPPEQVQTEKAPASPPGSLVPTGGVQSGSETIKTESLIRGMDTPRILARDQEIRAQLDRLENRNDREMVLVRTLASSYVVGDFNRAYSLIYGSQIVLLATLNSAGEAGLSKEAIRPIYDDAVKQYPEEYKDYAFEQWLDFLKRVDLIKDSANGVAITEWGNEFLVHLARSKRPVLKLL